tara:strand:+ start:92 stop:337 length:246 start_codon:yes stop_codon:yes gene_type:complete
MGDRVVLGKRELTPTGYESRGSWSWDQIGEHLKVTTGRTYTRQHLQSICYQALQKLRNALMDDPVIREWMCEEGLISPDDL